MDYNGSVMHQKAEKLDFESMHFFAVVAAVMFENEKIL